MKIHRNTITPLLWEILRDLILAPELDQFRLVGGTALSLQLGHRQSDDLDMFTDAEYGTVDFQKIDTTIKKSYGYVDSGLNVPVGPGRSYFIGHSKNECIKLDLFYHDKFIHPPLVNEGLRLAGPEDILLMKLRIIVQNNQGRKKDFWDIHELLDHFTLGDMIGIYNRHSPVPVDYAVFLERMADTARAEFDPEPRCLRGKYWELIKIDIAQEIDLLKSTNRSFE